jgi:hypothetical protein
MLLTELEGSRCALLCPVVWTSAPEKQKVRARTQNANGNAENTRDKSGQKVDFAAEKMCMPARRAMPPAGLAIARKHACDNNAFLQSLHLSDLQWPTTRPFPLWRGSTMRLSLYGSPIARPVNALNTPSSLRVPGCSGGASNFFPMMFSRARREHWQAMCERTFQPPTLGKPWMHDLALRGQRSPLKPKNPTDCRL